MSTCAYLKHVCIYIYIKKKTKTNQGRGRAQSKGAGQAAALVSRVGEGSGKHTGGSALPADSH